VLAVAHALETNRTVTGEDIEAVIDGRPGPLVDGRVYHRPEFAEVAEAYHTRAVEAHRGHGKLAVRLSTVADWCRTRPPRAVAARDRGRPAAPLPPAGLLASAAEPGVALMVTGDVAAGAELAFLG
jgi:cell division protease FtsH